MDPDLNGLTAGYMAAIQLVLGQLLKDSPRRGEILAALSALVEKMGDDMTDAAMAENHDLTARMVEAQSAADIFLAAMERPAG